MRIVSETAFQLIIGKPGPDGRAVKRAADPFGQFPGMAVRNGVSPGLSWQRKCHSPRHFRRKDPKALLTRRWSGRWPGQTTGAPVVIEHPR